MVRIKPHFIILMVAIIVTSGFAIGSKTPTEYSFNMLLDDTTGGIWTNVSGTATFEGPYNATDLTNDINVFMEGGHLVVEG